MEDKPIKESTAIVIYDKDHKKVLTVRRPLDDTSLPGHWGFPAASRKDDSETWEEVAHKAARTKLGVEIKIMRFIGEDTVDRGNFILRLRDYECEIVQGEPKVPQDDHSVTQYIEMEYTDNYSKLIESAKNKSLCTKIFLEEKNININE
jgi:hypothetical protein